MTFHRELDKVDVGVKLINTGSKSLYNTFLHCLTPITHINGLWNAGRNKPPLIPIDGMPRRRTPWIAKPGVGIEPSFRLALIQEAHD